MSWLSKDSIYWRHVYATRRMPATCRACNIAAAPASAIKHVELSWECLQRMRCHAAPCGTLRCLRRNMPQPGTASKCDIASRAHGQFAYKVRATATVLLSSAIVCIYLAYVRPRLQYARRRTAPHVAARLRALSCVALRCGAESGVNEASIVCAVLSVLTNCVSRSRLAIDLMKQRTKTPNIKFGIRMGWLKKCRYIR